MAEIHEVLWFVYLAAAFLSTFFNSVAIHLIITKSGPRMRKYSPFLAMLCVVGFFYGLLISIVQPRLVNVARTPFSQIVVSHGPVFLLLGPTPTAAAIVHALYSICAVLFNVYILTYALSFLYRYLVLARPTFIVNRLTPTLVFILFGTITLYALSIGVATLVARTRLTNVTRPDLGGIQLTMAFENDDSLIGGMLLTGLCTLNLFLSYSCIVFCAFRVYMMLKKTRSHLSPATRRGHEQLFHALLVQALLPMLHFIPLFATGLVLSRFDEFPLLEYLSFALIAWMPVLDPLCTIWFIEPYKRAALPCCTPTVGKAAPSGVVMVATSRAAAEEISLDLL